MTGVAQEMDALTRLRRDLRAAAKDLSQGEVRYLVDAYYQMQQDRIRSSAQARSLRDTDGPHLVIQWLAENTATLERNIKSALDSYTQASPIGQWATKQIGIGPVISAGLESHIDIEKPPTAGNIWSFAGLDPTTTWAKGKKRPWNARLKVICWKAGESFVKVSGNEKAVYGRLWAERKALEVERNEAGAFTEQTKEKLKRFKIDKSKEAYKVYAAGRLPAGHLHARAKRWAVKIFLSHWQHVAWRR